MKTIKTILPLILVITIFGCKKSNNSQQIIPIPNGDFEQWDNMSNLISWQTNSCTACVPPYETYIVQKVTDASNGQFSAKFIYNDVYSSYAVNNFQISIHPSILTGFIKSNITIGDTAFIQIDLFSGSSIVDKGYFIETTSIGNYKKIEIPISQNSISIDSASIKIIGGKKQGTELYIDNLSFLKNN